MILYLVLVHKVQKRDYRPVKISARKSFSYERPPSCLKVTLEDAGAKCECA